MKKLNLWQKFIISMGLSDGRCSCCYSKEVNNMICKKCGTKFDNYMDC